MKRLITFLTTTLLLLVLVPKTAGAVDFYVKKVADTQGLYLWTGTTEWLGEWNNTKGNLSDIYVDENGDKWYKKTVNIPAGTKVQAIVHQGSDASTKSADSNEYAISLANSVITLSWDGEGGHTNTIADGSGKTFTEIFPNKIRYRVKGSTGDYVIKDVNFGGETSINLTSDKDYEFQISDEDGVWYGLNGSASMVVGGANDWRLYPNQGNCYLLTLKSGNYLFKVNKLSNEISVTVVYPDVNLSDYENKLMYRVDGTDSPANFATIDYNGNGIAKVQLEKGRTYKFKISNKNNSGDPEWFGSDGIISSSNTTLTGLEKGKTAKIVADRTGEYIFTVSWSGSKPNVTVTYPPEEIPAYTLRYKVKGSNDAFTIVALDDATHTTATVKLLANTIYEYEISGPNSVWFGDQGNGEMTSTNCMNWSFYKNKQCFIKTNNEGEYVFSVKWDLANEKAVVSVTYPNLKVGKYYLVVPDENLGNTPRAIANKPWLPEKHKAFEMVAGRERNQNTLNDDVTSLTLKIDGNKGNQLRYDDKGQIRFYIYDETNKQFYQPDGDDNVELMPQYRTSNNRDQVGSSHDNIKDSATGKYYYIKKESATVTLDGVDYPTMSLTFMFSKYNSERSYILNKGETPKTFSNGNCIYYVNEKGERIIGNANLLVAFLKTRAYNPGLNTSAKYYTEHIKGNGVYLVGSLTGDSYMNGVEENYDKDKFKMVPNYWLNGVIDNTIEPAQADSIVYSCEIKRGSASWDNFFLSFTTGDVLTTKGTDGTPNKWNPLLRPRVQNQMDAQALEGGIFYYLSEPGHGSDQSQSLNPLLSEERKENYASYRIYFNATYSTYRIEFYDKFCIGGPAVNGIENETGNDGEYFKADYRHGMIEETVNGYKCYRYRGEFVKGSTFAFFVNPETSALNYSEDDDFAAVNGNTADEWHTQAPVDEENVATKADYPYHNKVRWNTNGSSDIDKPSLGSNNNGILWTLPTGTYTIRFYNHNGIAADADNGNALYTVDKEVTLKNMSSTFQVWNEDKTELVDETFEYGGVRTFSDDCALMLPLGVKAYYVNELKDGRAIMKKVEKQIIPAHCPVIIYDLSMKAGRDSEGRTETKSISLSPVPDGYTETLVAGEKNYLIDCYDKDNVINTTEEIDGKTMYNFFLSNKVYRNGDFSKKVDAPLNFWRARSGATAKKNYTYLSVDKDIRPVFYTSEKNYVRPDDSDDIENSARNYCFILSFDDVDDDSVVTGIKSVNTTDKVKDSNDWYTIQGLKIVTPTVPGMYIHNGKKVILK